MTRTRKYSMSPCSKTVKSMITINFITPCKENTHHKVSNELQIPQSLATSCNYPVFPATVQNGGECKHKHSCLWLPVMVRWKTNYMIIAIKTSCLWSGWVNFDCINKNNATHDNRRGQYLNKLHSSISNHSAWMTIKIFELFYVWFMVYINKFRDVI